MNPLACIQEALGQILEYCYFHEKRNAKKMVIIAPGDPSQMHKTYLSHLRNVLGFGLYYQRYNLGTASLEDEW